MNTTILLSGLAVITAIAGLVLGLFWRSITDRHYKQNRLQEAEKEAGGIIRDAQKTLNSRRNRRFWRPRTSGSKPRSSSTRKLLSARMPSGSSNSRPKMLNRS